MFAKQNEIRREDTEISKGELSASWSRYKWSVEGGEC